MEASNEIIESHNGKYGCFFANRVKKPSLYIPLHLPVVVIFMLCC